MAREDAQVLMLARLAFRTEMHMMGAHRRALFELIGMHDAMRDEPSETHKMPWEKWDVIAYYDFINQQIMCKSIFVRPTDKENALDFARPRLPE